MKKMSNWLIENYITRVCHYICMLSVIAMTLLAIIAIGGCSSSSNQIESEREDRVIEITDPDSPICGFKIVIPDGVLSEDTELSISIESNPPEVSEPYLERNGSAIEITISGESTFAGFIRVTIPLNEWNPTEYKIPLVGFFNEETDDWEILPSIYDPDENTLTCSINHLSLFTVLGVIMVQELYDIITDEDNEIYEKLVQLFDIIEQGSCASLKELQEFFQVEADSAYSVMEYIVDRYEEDPCGNSWVCGNKPFMDWLEDELSSALDDIVLSIYAQILVGSWAVSAIEVTSGLHALIATPCLSCNLLNSSLNPAFWAALIGYWRANLCITIAEKALEDFGCEDGLNDGLVAYYSFDNYRTGNSIVKDDSFHGNDMEQVYGQPKSRSGVSRRAIRFGEGKWICDGDNIHHYESLTVTFWYKHLSRIVDYPLLESLFDCAGGYYMKIANLEKKLWMGYWPSNLYAWGFWAHEDSLNDWSFMAITFNNGTFTVYKNASNPIQFDHPDGRLIPSGYSGLCIGGFGGTHAFGGLIDEFRIYNRVLSKKEIAFLFDYPFWP